jgi:hypothetical protein
MAEFDEARRDNVVILRPRHAVPSINLLCSTGLYEYNPRNKLFLSTLLPL